MAKEVPGFNSGVQSHQICSVLCSQDGQEAEVRVCACLINQITSKPLLFGTGIRKSPSRPQII